jgi:hypothetical protein
MGNSNSEPQKTNDANADEKAELELEKLRAEIANLKRGNSLGAKLAQYNILFTVAIAVLGAVISISQITAQQKNAGDQLEAQSKRDYESRENESKKKYWEEQNQTYKEAIEAASAIAVAASLEEVKSERKKFWQLYWGKMSLIETSAVEKAMVAFGSHLQSWEANKEKPLEIQNSAFVIAHCARKSLQKTWSPVDIGDLRDKQCKYE